MPAPLYLDAIATTGISDSVRQYMLPFLETVGLPSSAHSAGLDARDALEAARASCLAFVDAPERSTCVFTGSGTEANNLAILGLVRCSSQPSRVVTSRIEHPSVAGACEALQREGHSVVQLEVDSAGRLDADLVHSVLQEGDVFISHLANYDIGTRQNLKQLGEVCRQRCAVYMVDATYGAGWTPFSLQECGADIVSFSPHRFFGPSGIGVLVFRPGIQLQPLYFGGNQEQGLSPGTGSVVLAVGAGEACRQAIRHQQLWIQQTFELQKLLIKLLEQQLECFQLNGPAPGPERDPHHISLSIRGVEGEAVLLNLDLKGVQLTSNTGCITVTDKISPVLLAIGVEQEMAVGSLVIGLLPTHSRADIQHGVELILSSVQRIRSMSQSWHQHQSGV